MARGGAREGAGRPIGSVSGKPLKEGRIVIACLKEEELKIKEMAKASGKSISRFIVDKILSE